MIRLYYLIRLTVLLWDLPWDHFMLISSCFFTKTPGYKNVLPIKRVYYRRYVDDLFISFRPPDHILPLSYLKSKHHDINFTYEAHVKNKLSLLDIEILRSNGKFITSVYHKPIFPGLFTNFDSFILLNYK